VSGTNTDRTGDREYRGLLNVNCVVLHRDLGCVGGGGGGVALTCRECLCFLGILVLARGVVNGDDFGAQRSRVGVKERKF
jgi:hypothetical protein